MIKRAILSPVSRLYGAVTGVRNHWYDRNFLRSFSVSAPVISVGNITAGGTGKTPVIDNLLSWAKGSQLKAGVVSRGYKGSFQGVHKVDPQSSDHYYGDEPSMLAAKHPEAVVYVGSDRVAASESLLRDEKVDLVFADDAFQHRRLKRDLDVVIVDVTQSAHDYQILPLGLGRESLDGLGRADYVILNKVNLVSEAESQAVISLIESHLRPEVSQRLVTGHYNIKQWRGLLQKTPENQAPQHDWLLVSGIGRPASFEQMVRETRMGNVKGHLIYPDHHFYTEQDVAWIFEQLNEKQASHLLVTEKDAIKLSRFVQLQPITYVAQLSLELKGAVEHLYEDIRCLAR